MILAAYYTTHNTLVAMLIFLAALSLVALVVRQVRLRRHRELPFGMRPITLYRNSLITYNGTPMPKLTESVEAAIAEGIKYVPFRMEMQRTPVNLANEYAVELGNVLQAELLEDMSRTLLGSPRMINAWDDLMEADWA